MSNNNSQSKVGVEMANAMDEAIAKERKKNRKLKQKLSKAKKKLEKQSIDDDEEEGEEGHDDPNDPNSGWLKPGEVAIILHHMETSMRLLVGN